MAQAPEIQIKFRELIEQLIVKAVGGEFFAEMIHTDRHKVYMKGNQISSNILYTLSDS